MSEDYTVHPIEEFGTLPWDKLNCVPRNFSFGRGGYGLPDSTWHVTYIHEDLTSDIYVIPGPLHRLIEEHASIATQHVQEAVKTALGIR